MARRSAQNARYGKHTEPPGKTRKSAAAAKPKRSKGSAPTTAAPAKGQRKREPLVLHPDTPEYKFWRRVWWALLGVAVVLVAVSWFIPREGREMGTPAYIALGAAYASIFAALAVDWLKLRKIRTEWMREQQNPQSKSQKKKAEKAAKVQADEADAPSKALKSESTDDAASSDDTESNQS